MSEHRFTIDFRGSPREVIIAAVYSDDSVGFTEVDWSFAEPEFNSYALTSEEEDTIAASAYDYYRSNTND